ncbi:MAG: MBL fold metallo-hydrolase [Planctomycetes bacterium]|nr:MBL fold metallo-hydrolase [Planctomycetota bacterium]
MRTWHLNCGTLRPPGGRFVNGEGGIASKARLVCHCLVVETARDGLVLIDTGFGEQDLHGRGFLHRTRLKLLGASVGEDEPAVRQLARLGYQPSDVRHIVLTHLDLDHAGGLADFPLAEVHVYAAELEAALNPQTLMDRNRYRPVTWAHRPRWVRHRVEGERWKGFECVRRIQGLPPEILLVPMLGHTRGHCAIAVETDQGFLLHAGDAYFHAGQVHPNHPFCPSGLDLFQQVICVDDVARRQNLERLRDLVRDHGHEVRVFSAHDPDELNRCVRVADELRV